MKTIRLLLLSFIKSQLLVNTSSIRNITKLLEIPKALDTKVEWKHLIGQEKTWVR
jgi:hypothetical protein